MDTIVTISNGRCFFNGLTAEEDRDPKTGKAGVGSCGFQILGFILYLIRITCWVPCIKDGKLHNCFIYVKDFKLWVKRHEHDDCFDGCKHHKRPFFDMATTIRTVTAQILIDKTCRRFQKRKIYLASRKINPGQPLSLKEILKVAERKFARHCYKADIIKHIQEKLGGDGDKTYEERVKWGWVPYYYDSGACYRGFRNGKLHGKERKEADKKDYIIKVAYKFFRKLPGFDRTTYRGPVLV